MFNYQDVIKKEQVASNGTLELSELRGKKAPNQCCPPHETNI